MKTATILATGVSAVLACSSAAHAGIIEYSIHGDLDTAEPGDTVTLTVDAHIDPQGGPFFALAAAAFDVLVDDVPSGGIVDFTSPGLGLAPDFSATGFPGTLVDDDILGIQAAQLPGMLNPAINTDLDLTLYTFQYTPTDPTQRTVTFSMSNVSSFIYGGTSGGASVLFTSSQTPFHLQVNPVPAPGAFALLGCAGFVSRRRRRR